MTSSGTGVTTEVVRVPTRSSASRTWQSPKEWKPGGRTLDGRLQIQLTKNDENMNQVGHLGGEPEGSSVGRSNLHQEEGDARWRTSPATCSTSTSGRGSTEQVQQAGGEVGKGPMPVMGDPSGSAPATQAVKRSWPVRREHLAKYGRTDGCPGCTSLVLGAGFQHIPTSGSQRGVQREDQEAVCR